MKGIEPVICKKFRRIFKNTGYKTFLVNEFRTSKLWNCCNNESEHFLERKKNQRIKVKWKYIMDYYNVNRLYSVQNNS